MTTNQRGRCGLATIFVTCLAAISSAHVLGQQVSSSAHPTRDEINEEVEAGNAYIQLAGDRLPWKSPQSAECNSARLRIRFLVSAETALVPKDYVPQETSIAFDALQIAEENNLQRIAAFSSLLAEAVRARCFALPASAAPKSKQ